MVRYFEKPDRVDVVRRTRTPTRDNDAEVTSLIQDLKDTVERASIVMDETMAKSAETATVAKRSASRPRLVAILTSSRPPPPKKVPSHG